jgi:hypothetical protein
MIRHFCAYKRFAVKLIRENGSSRELKKLAFCSRSFAYIWLQWLIAFQLNGLTQVIAFCYYALLRRCSGCSAIHTVSSQSSGQSGSIHKTLFRINDLVFGFMLASHYSSRKSLLHTVLPASHSVVCFTQCILLHTVLPASHSVV